MNVYATLISVRRYLSLNNSQVSDDDLLLVLLGAASRLIDGYTGRTFYPTRQTRTYAYTDPVLLLLRDDLLDLHTLINGDGRLLVPAIYHTHPSGVSVKSSVVLDRTQALFTHEGDPVDAITIEGTWGYHSDWPNAWADSGDGVQDDPLSSSATVFIVTDVDAPLMTGYGQRFAVGQLLHIEDEYMHVLAVDTAQNSLTVARGVNGTTATAHAPNTPIAVYHPPEDIRQTCLRVTTWLYKQQDAGFAHTTGGLRGQLVVPPALPPDVQQILTPYVRLQIA